jgi:hypothetical protein
MGETKQDPSKDPRFNAALKMLERTGMREFCLGWSDPEDGPPIVFYARGSWRLSPQGKPLPKGGRLSHEAAGALDPVQAVLRLCEQVIDGGECTHCHLPTIFEPSTNTHLLDLLGCVYAWDPELEVFRRGCEGDEKK